MFDLDGYDVKAEIYGSRRGILYAGTRKADRKPVILKKFIVPPDKQGFADKYIARYLRESQWLKNLSHPNIIGVLEIIPPSADRPVPILVMERLDHTLQQEYQNGNARHDDIVAWMVQVLLGLKALHDNEILHRDIKSSNIMLDGQGTAKIIDLSIAVKLGDEITLTPEDISTSTAAPEMYKGRAGANFSSDIYSLGFTIYQLLLGKQQFEEQFAEVLTDSEQENLYRWMYWHCDKNAALRSLSEQNPSIPEYLSNIVAKMTAKNVDERYQTVDEVLSDLANAVQSSDKKEAFVLIIKDSIPSDYWKGSLSYRLDEEPDAEEKTEAPPKKSKKRTLLLAFALVWVIALGGGAFFFMSRPKPVAVKSDDAGEYVKNAREAYRASQYPEAKKFTADGLKYIEGLNADGHLNNHAAFLRQLDKDVDWMTGLESRLTQAVTSVRLPNADEARTALSALLSEKYDKGDRFKTLHEVSSVKFDELQANAKDWLDSLDRTVPIYAARADSKYRRAHHVLLATELPERIKTAVTADIVPVINALDTGRTHFDTKEFAPARESFQQAFTLGEGKVGEAAYHLSLLAVGPLATMDPMKEVESHWAAFDKPGTNQSIALAMGRLADLRVRAYDLDHRLLDPAAGETDLVPIEPGMRNLLAGAYGELNQSIETIVGDLRTQMAKAQEAGPEVFNPTLPEQCKFPLEDSQADFLNRFADVLRLRIGTALDDSVAGNTQALQDATVLAERMPESMPDAERRYLHARLNEHSLLGGTPDKAVETYRSLLGQHPSWAECDFRIAIVSHFLEKDDKQSAAAFAEAMRLAPENERFRWWAAKVAVERATLAVEAKDWATVSSATEEALAAWPDFPTAYFARAMAALAQNDASAQATNLDEFKRAFAARKYRYAMEDQYMKLAEKLAPASN